MAKPSFVSLWLSYPTDLQPCDGPWANQCAIRMSITLNAEKTLQVNAKTYSEPKCAHHHARGAESLANWLYHKIGRPAVHKDGGKAKLLLDKKTGIIFFRNCFTREGEHKKVGDHIDLWKQGIVKTYDDPSNNAEEVWFWELK